MAEAIFSTSTYLPHFPLLIYVGIYKYTSYNVFQLLFNIGTFLLLMVQPIFKRLYRTKDNYFQNIADHIQTEEMKRQTHTTKKLIIP